MIHTAKSLLSDPSLESLRTERFVSELRWLGLQFIAGIVLLLCLPGWGSSIPFFGQFLAELPPIHYIGLMLVSAAVLLLCFMVIGDIVMQERRHLWRERYHNEYCRLALAVIREGNADNKTLDALVATTTAEGSDQSAAVQSCESDLDDMLRTVIGLSRTCRPIT